MSHSGTHTRRKVLLGASSMVTAYAVGQRSAVAQVGRLPDPSLFKSGDLLWTRTEWSFAGYSSGFPSGPVAEKIAWEEMKNSAVAKLSATGAEEDLRAAVALKSATYEEFILRYREDLVPGEFVPHSARPNFGHVAIIDARVTGDPHVVEAVPNVVRRVPYAKWLEGAADRLVWHGEIPAVEAARLEFVLQAIKHMGKPYNLWHSSLFDPSDFYCSKLVWLAAHEATNGIALDGDRRPAKRLWPLSPTRLYNSAKIIQKPF
jgi:hypothetical protein